MSNYVYAIVNKINLKLYFGSHSWDGEGLDPNYYGSGKIIKRAIKKYGKNNFIVYPIKFYDTIEECRKAEEELLRKHNIANNPYCYNIKNGAIGWTSDDMKGENNPMYGRTGEKHPMYGKHFTLSEEHKKKISQAMTGENNPMYGRTGENNPNYGKHLSESTRKKMSQARKGEKHPFYGKPRTEETKNKLAISKGGKPFVAMKDGKVKIFTSQCECSRVLGLNQGNINRCLKGRLKTTGGYSFKYVEELDSGIYEGIL